MITTEERKKLKVDIMTKLVSEIAQGKIEEFAGKIGKDGVLQFLTNVEFMADEILKRGLK